jgi:predicted HicB family RNase H-like nuclease
MLNYKGPGWYTIFFDANRQIQAWFWPTREDAAFEGDIYEVKNVIDFWEAVMIEIQKEFQI